ncbi:MAG: class I tRNA ligase family protein [Candidatus Hodgkinia cicadicola]
MAFNICLPKKQRSHKNENALIYQHSNKSSESASAIGRRRFSVLDGPPYANGEIHTGHIINKLLKQAAAAAHSLIGKRMSLKANWDCHGLPIEIEVLKRKKCNKAIEFLCRVYALNWIKTQIAQFKLIGFRCYKPKTSMSVEAQLRILDKLYSLVGSKNLALGKKPVAWSLDENSSISENDIEQKLTILRLADTFTNMVLRKQTEHANKSTVLKLMLKRLGGCYKLLGLKLFNARAWVWSLPWTACVSLPSKLNIKLHNKKIISACNMRQTWTAQTKSTPALIIRALSSFNVFSERAVPLANWQFNNIQSIAPTTTSDAASKLVWCPTSPTRYNFNKFKRSAFNKTASTTRGEIHVINKLITNALIQSCYVRACKTLASTRSKALVVNWVSVQLYIKLTQAIKLNIINVINSTQFFPKTCKTLIANLVLTRPDWVVSRQRRWGIPMCMLANRSNKVMLDNKLRHRIKQLFCYHKENCWRSFRPLRCGYRRQSWRQIVDVVDVWFDASTVYALRAGYTKAWDLVIEGADQHRGWFQSTLITSALTESKPPIKTILTHGFAMQAHNKKMSKSELAQTARTFSAQLANLNANVIRMWACTIRPFENQIINPNWLLKSKATYNKVINTLNWGLNVIVCSPKAELQNNKLTTSANKFILHKLRLYSSRVAAYYIQNEICAAAGLAAKTCELLLTAYFDAIKDQIYCDFRWSANRLNTIAVLKCAIFQVITWLAPVIPNTCYKLKRKLGFSNNVINKLPNNWFNMQLATNWATICKLKKLLSKLQAQVGHSLAEVGINIYTTNRLKLTAFKNTNIALVVGCSKANLIWTNSIPNFAIMLSKALAISVWKANFVRCARCRKRLYVNELSNRA